MLIKLRTQAAQLSAQGLRDQAAELIEKAAKLEHIANLDPEDRHSP
jgi:hypothetical protein